MSYLNSSKTSTKPFWQRILSEPILHFIVLGGIVFALDGYFFDLRRDQFIIKVDQAQQDELGSLYRVGRGYDPDPQELNGLISRWVDSEILYREGLALGLDRGDLGIRERVISNIIGLIKSSAKEEVDDADFIKKWLDNHRSTYHVLIESRKP